MKKLLLAVASIALGTLAGCRANADRMAGAPFYYNARSGKFERYPFAAGQRGGWVLFYLPTTKTLWQYAAGGATLIGNTTTHQWTDARAKGRPRRGSISEPATTASGIAFTWAAGRTVGLIAPTKATSISTT